MRIVGPAPEERAAGRPGAHYFVVSCPTVVYLGTSPQPSFPMADNDGTEKPLTTGEWFVTLLVLGLPLVGLVMYLVWGFGTGNVSRRNFCRAVLLWLAIGLVLGLLTLIAFVIFGGTLAALINQAGNR